MSLLLDAIKQSAQHEQTAVDHDQAALQLKQQQELTRYKRLAFSFGLLLAAILTLMAGFSIGKWLQQSKPFAEQPVVANENEKVPSATAENVAGSKDQEQLQTDNSVAKLPSGSQPVVAQQQMMQQPPQQQTMMQQVPVQGAQQYQWVQVPVNTVPVYANQAQPQYAQPVYQNQAAYQPQPQFSQPMQMQQAAPRPTNSNGIDYSKYKVLGKPLDENANNQTKQAEPDDELNEVSDSLKKAFAQAVQDVDQQRSSQVTHSTKNSSYADPIELLPESIQNAIPTLKYQAHIYASEPSKRWIKLNGRELYEGDNIGVLSLIEITPEQSLLSYDGYEFTLKALQDWPE